MPQLDPSSYASQIFWLLICFFTMMFIMANFIVPKIADIRQQRENKIDGYLHKAEEFKQKTEKAVQRYEEALHTATKTASEALQNTKDELNQMIGQKQTSLDKKLQKKIKTGEAEILKEKENALKEIKSVSADITAELLHKLNINDIKLSDIKQTIEQEAK